MKVVALVLGALLGAAAIPYLPRPEPWDPKAMVMGKRLHGPLDRWFRPAPKPSLLRFE